jgi:tRNA U38,U39,U40 pseudouridine synthase TruA
LYRMVRRIVGALARVGRGQITVGEFAAAFHSADGTWPNQTAPPRGLCLTKVMYE